MNKTLKIILIAIGVVIACIPIIFQLNDFLQTYRDSGQPNVMYYVRGSDVDRYKDKIPDTLHTPGYNPEITKFPDNPYIQGMSVDARCDSKVDYINWNTGDHDVYCTVWRVYVTYGSTTKQVLVSRHIWGHNDNDRPRISWDENKHLYFYLIDVSPEGRLYIADLKAFGF